MEGDRRGGDSKERARYFVMQDMVSITKVGWSSDLLLRWYSFLIADRTLHSPPIR